MVYIDMDGVVADFSVFMEEYGVWSDENAIDFVSNSGFANLPRLKGADVISDLITNYGAKNFTFLSSCGGLKGDLAAEVVAQKRAWLDANGFSRVRLICVAHKGLKKHYASPDSLLIDDTKQNVWDFEENFGVGVRVRDKHLGATPVHAKTITEFLNGNNESVEYYNISEPRRSYDYV